jgi:hypothetical protein
MKRIFKYPLEVTDEQRITGKFVKILCVKTQNEVPCIWAEVDESLPQTAYVNVFMHGTGHTVNSTANYLGTAFLKDGEFVYHVYVGNIGWR